MLIGIFWDIIPQKAESAVLTTRQYLTIWEGWGGGGRKSGIR